MYVCNTLKLVHVVNSSVYGVTSCSSIEGNRSQILFILAICMKLEVLPIV